MAKQRPEPALRPSSFNEAAVISHRTERDVLTCPYSWWVGLSREAFAVEAAVQNVTRLRYVNGRAAHINLLD